MLALVFSVLTLVAAGIIYMAYERGSEQRRTFHLGKLASFVDFKVNAVSDWLKERRGNAHSVSSMSVISTDLGNWLTLGDEMAKTRLDLIMFNLQQSYGFRQVRILKPNGVDMMSGEAVGVDHPELAEAIERLKITQDIQLVDLHPHKDGKIYLGFLAPIFSNANPIAEIIGMVLFTLDANDHLYPLVEHWPEQGTSIEISLMRPEGKDVTYLSPMRDQPDALFSRQHIHQAPNILDDLVMTPDSHPYKGKSKDHNGKPVLVAGKPVPETPWHLLIKMDEEEVLVELRRLIITTSIMAALAFMITFAILHILWQRQRLQQAVSEAKLTRQVKESEENYRAIFSHSNVPSVVLDPVSHEILNANEAAADFYGFDTKELKGMRFNRLSGQSPEEIDEVLIQATSKEKTRFENHHTLANGEIRDVEVFFAPLVFDGIYRIFSVIIDVSERKRLERQLQEMATTDSLTKLPNRRYFMEKMREQLNLLARGASQHAAIMMLDLDHFKSINDTLGHNAGDEVLQQVAQLMRDQLRKVDFPGRLGGEEFAILLPGVGAEEAKISAERLRLAIATQPRVLSDGCELSHSVSIGISELLVEDMDIKIPLARADRALYQAKEQGRNRTVLADPDWI